MMTAFRMTHAYNAYSKFCCRCCRHDYDSTSTPMWSPSCATTWTWGAPAGPTTPARASTTSSSNAHINQLPDLIEKCRSLVDAQYKEADRALLGLGDYTLRPAYCRHRQTLSRWQSMSDCQRQRLVADCFRLHLPTDTSASTDGQLTVNYRPTAGKKLNQHRRPRAERTQ